jgi:hypothetical protein
MKKPGTKPFSDKSSAATPRPTVIGKATPTVVVRPAANHVPRSTPKAAQPPQPVAAAKQPVAARRSTPWTVEAASRVYRASTVENGGKIPKESFAAQAMSNATKGALPLKVRSR